MEVLTAGLKRSTSSPAFKYYWKARLVSLMHLIFADDIMLYSHGDQLSINCLLNGVNSFSAISWLRPNWDKSSCFFANVAEETKAMVLSSTGFKLGTLPIRYLGLPLISTKLSQRD